MRDKLKELLETEAGSDKLRDLKAAGEQIAGLQREIEVLRAQNSALRIAVESSESVGPSFEQQRTHSDRLDSENGTRSESKWESSRGHLLGEVPGSVSGPTGSGPAAMEEYRQQMHAKWENEKKLQKR